MEREELKCTEGLKYLELVHDPVSRYSHYHFIDKEVGGLREARILGLK